MHTSSIGVPRYTPPGVAGGTVLHGAKCATPERVCFFGLLTCRRPPAHWRQQRQHPRPELPQQPEHWLQGHMQRANLNRNGVGMRMRNALLCVMQSLPCVHGLLFNPLCMWESLVCIQGQ